MPTTRLRDAADRLLRSMAAAALAAAALSCGEHDAAGPGIPAPASLAVAPTFATIPVGGPVLVLDRVDGWLVPLPSGDSAFASASFRDGAAALDFRPTVVGEEQRFVFRIEAFDADDERLFAASDTLLVRPGDNPPVDGLALAYVARDAAVASFAIAGRTSMLGGGDTVQLKARACCTDGEQLFPINAGWVSRDPTVATADQGSGVVSAVAPGKAWIVATLFNGTRDSVEVAVGGGVEAVSIESAPPTLEAIGATTTLAAAARDATGSPMDVAILWRTLDPAVATVEQGSGVVTASSNGEAAIVAEAGGRADTVVVVVAQRPASIEATALDEELVAIGRATTITALGRDANGHPVPGLAIAFAPLPELGAGQLQLGAAGSAGGAQTMPAFAMMVQEPTAGTSIPAVAIAVGEAWVEAWAWSDAAQSVRVADSVRVVVRQVAATVNVVPAALALLPGDTATLAVEARDSAGVVIPDPDVSWTTTDPLVATVDAAGLVTATGLGAAAVAATVDGTSGTSAVDVADVPPLARTWVGGDLAGPGDWTNPANWSPAGAPRVADTVLVPATAWAPALWVDATVAAVSVDAGASLQVDGTLTVTGSVSGALAGAGTVRVAGDGNVAGTVPSLHVTGTALADADLQVAGDLVVDAGGTLVVKSAEVRVEGLALFAGKNVEGTLTGGTLSLGGDFAAKGVDAFRPDAGFLVVFRGAKAPQMASMDAPGSASQRFADVVVANATAEGVRFEGVAIGGALRDDGVQPARMRFDGAPSRVDGAVSLALPGSIGGGGSLTVLGELDAPSTSVSVAVLRLAGAKGTTTLGALADGHALLEMVGADQPLRSGLAYRGVRITGRAHLLGPEPVTVDGSLTIEGDVAELAPQGTPLVVTGDLATAKLGVLAMRNDADDVTVKGSVTIDGGPTAEALVFGTLRVSGHFTVLCETAECFQPSENGTLVVELDGPEAQEVALALPGAPGTGNDLQRFRHIRVANAKGVTFATGVAVRGDLLVVAGAHATIPDGVWVDVHGALDVDSSGSDPGWIDNFGELYAGDDRSSGQVKPNQVLPRK